MTVGAETVAGVLTPALPLDPETVFLGPILLSFFKVAS